MNQHVVARTASPGLAIASRRVVFADKVCAATIHVQNGLFSGIEIERIAPGAVDMGDDLLMPGLVELHTDHLEPHFAPRPQVRWDPVSAVFSYDAQIATAGITTVFDSLRAGSDADRNATNAGLNILGEAIEQASKTGLLRADHHTHLRCEICSDDVVEEVERHLQHFDVRLLSLMDHTPGARQFRDEEKLRVYYRGKMKKTEQELDAYFAARRALFASNHDRNRASLVAIARARRISLASHDDTTVEHVRESHQDGAMIAEFPTTLEAAQASHEAGMSVLMGAPNVVRGGSHSGNVSAVSLAEAGYLDILSSDYVPSSLIEGAFALRSIAAIGGLAPAIRLVTKNPAEATGMTDRGEIAVGKRADFLRVRLVADKPVVREVHRQGARVA